MDFDKVLKGRKSIRSFCGKAVSFKDVVEICEAVRFSPIAGNVPTIKLVLISDKKKIGELTEAALRQECIAKACHVIAVCSDTDNIVRSYGERGKIFARQQAGAAIENMLLKVTDLGLASCWVGAFDEEMVKRALEIPKHVQVEALLPIGCAKGKIPAKTKPELKSFLSFERYGVKTTKPEQRDNPFRT